MAATSFVAATISACVLMGGLLTLFASLSQAAREHLRLTERKGVWLSVCFTMAMVLFTFVGGLMVNAWGLNDVLTLGALTGAFSIACLGVSREFRASLLAAFLMGASAGALHTAAATAMPGAFSDFGNAPAALNFGYSFVILGCLLTPFVGRFLVARLGYRNGLLALALAAVAPAVFATLANSDMQDPPAGTVDLAGLMGDFRLWLGVVGVFCYHAVEISAVKWAGQFLTEVGYGARSRGALLIAFWMVFLASRLVFSWIGGDLMFTWVLLILAILSAAVLGNMIGFYNRGSGGLSFLMLGAVIGPVFPSLVGLIYQIFAAAPFQQPAVALGLVFALGTMGRLIAEPMITYQVSKDQTRTAVGWTTVLMLVVIVPALVYWLFVK